MNIICENKDDRHLYLGQFIRATIAYQVRLLRLQRKWSQQELAEKCGMPQSTISHVEDWDRAAPTVATLIAIAQAFDVALIIKFDGWKDILATIVESYHDDDRPPAHPANETGE